MEMTKEELQKRHQLYMKELHIAAMAYLRDMEVFERAAQDRASADLRIAAAQDRLDANRRLLAESVQPICGSATKPHRRLFKLDDRSNKVLVVNHDHGKFGVSVTVESLVTEPGGV